jgi:hypothetical protein
MALILNPRIFLVPAFYFEKDGAFAFVEKESFQRNIPENIFSCSVLEHVEDALPPLFRDTPFETFWITVPEMAEPLLFLYEKDDTSLFWRIVLFSRDGKDCEEQVCFSLWQKRLFQEMSYISFETKWFSYNFHAEGRLLDLVLYFLLLEKDEGVNELMAAIQSQTLKGCVAHQWQDLMSFVTVDLASKHGLVQHLTEKYGVVANLVENLTAKTKK